MNLPPLPQTDFVLDRLVEEPGWGEESMRAYGQACADAAMEEAAVVADSMATRNYTWGSENSDRYHAQAAWAALIAKKIRALKGST